MLITEYFDGKSSIKRSSCSRKAKKLNQKLKERVKSKKLILNAEEPLQVFSIFTPEISWLAKRTKFSPKTPKLRTHVSHAVIASVVVDGTQTPPPSNPNYIDIFFRGDDGVSYLRLHKRLINISDAGYGLLFTARKFDLGAVITKFVGQTTQNQKKL